MANSTADGSVVIDVDMNVSDAEKELDRLKKRIYKVEDDLGDKKAQKTSLEKKLEEAQKKLADFQNSAKEVDGRFVFAPGAEQQIVTIKSNIQELEGEIEKYNKSIERGEVTLEFTKRRYGEILAEAERLGSTKLMDYNGDLGKAQEAVQQFSALQQELSDLENKRNGLGLALGAKEEYNELSARIGDVRKELEDCRSALDSMAESGALNRLAGGSEIAEQRIAELRQRLADLQQQQAGLGLAIGAKKEYEALSGEIAETSHLLEAYEANVDQETLALRELSENAEMTEPRIAELNQELAALEGRKKVLESAGIGLGYREYEETAARIKEINKELQDYQANLTPIEVKTKKSAGYMDRFGKRIRSILASVFVFNVLSAGLRQFTDWAGKAVRSNDEARQAIARLKGALLTLAQPLIEVVVPAFTALVNVLARVVNTIAQLMSALFGKTLRQSKDSAKALYDEANAMEGVGSAARDAAGSLAGFDEINTISTDTGGGGGGSGSSSGIAPDFTWDELDDGLLKKLEEIGGLVTLIGAGFALWKIGSALPGILGTIATNLGLILMTIGGILLFWDGLTDAWENGVDWINLTEMILGLAAAAGALYLLLGPIAAGIALVVGGIAMLVTGFHDAMENGWNLQNTLLSVAGILATGLGIALLTGSWIPLLIAGIAAVLLALTVATGHGDELLAGIKMALDGFLDFFKGIFTGDFDLAVQGLKKIFEGLKTAFGAVLDGIRDAFNFFLDWLDEKTGGRLHGIIDTIRKLFGGLISSIQFVFAGLIEFFAGIFSGDLEQAMNGLSMIVDGLKFAIGGILDAIMVLFLQALDWLDEKTNGQFHDLIENAKVFVIDFFLTAKETLLGLLDAVKDILSGIIKFLTGVFTGDWETAWEGVKDIFKGIWNGIVTLLEGAVNFIITGINSMIRSLNSIRFPDWVPLVGGSGINIPTIPRVELPRLAQGAVIPPNREFMAVLGDQRSGNNIEAPESLIRRIVREESGGGNTALLEAILEAVRAGHIIMVDRRVLGQTVTQEQNRMTRQSGRSVLLG